MENMILSQKLVDLLGLDSPPIAIKIVKTEEPLPNIKVPDQRSRYCQLLSARYISRRVVSSLFGENPLCSIL